MADVWLVVAVGFSPDQEGDGEMAIEDIRFASLVEADAQDECTRLQAEPDARKALWKTIDRETVGSLPRFIDFASPTYNDWYQERQRMIAVFRMRWDAVLEAHPHWQTDPADRLANRFAVVRVPLGIAGRYAIPSVGTQPD